jgi:hypothetical protein
MDRRKIVALPGCALAVSMAAPARADIVDDDPAIAAQGVGDMRVFVRGTDGALWTKSWNGSSWSPWSSLGGVLTSGPVVSVRPGGVYDVFVRGSDNGYYHKYFSPNTGWSQWGALNAGSFAFAPGASYRKGTGEIDVVGVGADRQLYHGYWASGLGWSGWTALGGALSGKPSSISPAPGILDVYMRGIDNQLYQKYWTSSSGWSGFVALGGGLTSGVAATAWDGNRRDIFARGGDSATSINSYQSPNWVGGVASAAEPPPGPARPRAGRGASRWSLAMARWS